MKSLEYRVEAVEGTIEELTALPVRGFACDDAGWIWVNGGAATGWRVDALGGLLHRHARGGRQLTAI